MDEAAAEVLVADRAWEDAIIRVDSAALDRIGASDLIYTHASGSVEGKAAFIDHIVNGRLRFTSIEYDDVEVRVHGASAVLTCALNLDTVDRAGDRSELHFRVTHVWIARDGRWQLLANQSTHHPVAESNR
jgi:ketosteroid isomerase-like protein